jgi:hypothetical protein
LYAFNNAGVRSTALTQEHMESARMATNLMLATFANKGVNLWAVDLIETPLVEGQSVYDVDANTVMILDAYMRIDNGSSPPIDRIIMPISRSSYASYPNKEQQGFTTVFWYDRLIAPTITLWPVPDGTSAQYLRYYRVRWLQDAGFAGGQTVEVPYLWLEAVALGLASRLAVMWTPDKVQMLKPLAEEAYQVAAMQNIEDVPTYISPSLSSYFRP